MKIRVTGNIGKGGATLRKFGEGDSDYVVNFSLGEHKKDSQGNKITVWHKVTFWRNRAKGIAPYLTQGRKVEIDGTLGKVETFTKNNEIHTVINIYANEIQWMDRKDDVVEAPAATDAELAAEAPAEEVEEAPWDAA